VLFAPWIDCSFKRFISTIGEAKSFNDVFLTIIFMNKQFLELTLYLLFKSLKITFMDLKSYLQLSITIYGTCGSFETNLSSNLYD